MDDCFEKGTPVWVEIDKILYKQASIIQECLSGGKFKVQLKTDTSAVVVDRSRLRKMDSAELEGVDDMIALPDLHEGALLNNLRIRYNRDDIYTNIGTILVAINPYKNLDLYDSAMVRRYHGVPFGQLPPHIFATADHCYESMRTDGVNQCVIISGESGAGKTESTKIILQYLATLSGAHNEIEERILACSPILEAFGNACTVRNNNSSRFGKFIEIQFARDGTMEGGKIHEFLLEKSRLVHQGKKESNYHVFYELLRGANSELLDHLGLTRNEREYHYLRQGSLDSTESPSTRNNFDRLKNAFDNLQVSEKVQASCYEILAAILHLGNCTFTAVTEETSVVTGHVWVDLEKAAQLLGLEEASLAGALTRRTATARKETFVTPLNIIQATESRDALSKRLYSWLFGFLVKTLNDRISRPKTGALIGILDVFGFEDFEINSFEQFLINYANERLQQFFNNSIFKLEQQVYREEGIAWQDITFIDNQPCLELISKKPTGIIQLLDEECQFPKASDSTFMEKIRKVHANSPFLEKSKVPAPVFVVSHYAGKVTYTVTGFLDKNHDLLRNDLERLLAASGNEFIVKLLELFESDEQAKRATLNSTGSAKSKTVAAKFDESLSLLITVLSASNPHFIRCVKPNASKLPSFFDDKFVLKQLQNAGVVETVKMRKSGFQKRIAYRDFVSRYWVLVRKFHVSKDDKHTCLAYLSSLTEIDAQKLEPSIHWRSGSSKLFLKEHIHTTLERVRLHELTKRVILLQTNARRFLCRQRYLDMMAAAQIIQIQWRRYWKVRLEERRTDAVITIQSFMRMVATRKRYRKQLQELIRTQRRIRVLLAQARIVYLYTEKTKRTKLLESPKSVHSAPLAEVEYIESFIANLDSVFEGEQPLSVDITKDLQRWKGFSFVGTPSAIAVERIDPNFEFEKYVQAYFVETSCGYTEEPIRKPLTRIPASLNEVATRCFLCIQFIAGTLSLESAVSPIQRILYVINAGLMNTELRDELYAQICSQIIFNSSTTLVPYWRLFTLYLCYFPPSTVMEKYLVSFCIKFAPGTEKVKLISAICTSVEKGSRKTAPSPQEIASICKGESWSLNFRLPDDTTMSTPFGPLSQCSDIVHSAMASMKATTYCGWSMFLANHILPLDAKQFVLDVHSGHSEKMFSTTAATKQLDCNIQLCKELLDPTEVIKDERLVDLVYSQVLGFAKVTEAAADLESTVTFTCGLLRTNGLGADSAFKTLKQFGSDAFRSQASIDIIHFQRLTESAFAKMALISTMDVKRVCIQALEGVPGCFGKKYLVQSVILADGGRLSDAYLSVETSGIHFLGTSGKVQGSLMYDDIQEIQINQERVMIPLLSSGTVQLVMHADMAVHMKEFTQKYISQLCASSTWARATLPFDSATEGQISVSVGDIMEIKERSNNSTWWSGINHSIESKPEGWFPVDFVTVLTRKPKTIPIRMVGTLPRPAPTDISDTRPQTIRPSEYKGSPTITRVRTGESSSRASPSMNDARSRMLRRRKRSSFVQNNDDSILGATMLSPPMDSNRKESVAPVRTDTDPEKSLAALYGVMSPIVPRSPTRKHTGFHRRISSTYESVLTDWAKVNVWTGEQKKVAHKQLVDMARVASDAEKAEMAKKQRELLVFSKAPLKDSLTRLTIDESNTAVKIFLLILRFCGDYPAKEATSVELARNIVNKTLQGSPALRTETYLQLMKQVSENPSRQSEANAWSLLRLVSSFFPPDESFVGICVKWAQFQWSKGNFKEFAEEFERNVQGMVKYGPRKHLASLEEVTFLEIGRPLILPVMLRDNQRRQVYLTPNTTCAAIVHELGYKLEFLPDQASSYALFIKYRTSEEMMIMHDEYVSDGILLSIDREKETSKCRMSDRAMILRRCIWPNVIPRMAAVEVEFLYSQLSETMVNGWLAPDSEQTTHLVAIQLLAQNTDPDKVTQAQLSNLLKKHVPEKTFKARSLDSWLADLRLELARVPETERKDPKMAFLQTCTQVRQYGACVYPVTGVKYDKSVLPTKAFLVVTAAGISILDSTTKNELASWKYAELVGWSFAADRINVKIGSAMEAKQDALKAFTPCGSEICYVIGEYVKRIAAERSVTTQQ